MKINVKKGNLTDAKSEALILALFEEDKKLFGLAYDVDAKSDGLISDIIKSRDFEAKHAQVMVIYTRGLLPAKRISLVGLGKKNEFKLEKLRAAYAKAMQHLRSLNITEAATEFDFNVLSGRKEEVVRAAVEGAVLGLYQYTPFKTVDRAEIKQMKQLEIFATGQDYALIAEEVRKARIITDAVCFVRDLVSAPANEMTPTVMAQKAREVARRKKVACKVLEKSAMKKLGMNALLGVASGSCQEPKFIILEYSGGKKGSAPIVLVGKGLTFDSGGISIKPSEKMDEMKTDMSGGAAVMGAIMAAADLQLSVNIVGLIPATENMPSGCALKPGDILKSYSGKTIEIVNTDAEGRLILADALAYASKYKPAAIIDIATLTGACVIALGDEVIGMMGTDEKLKAEINDAAQATGELVWELPLWDIYSEQIKSDIADYKNSGGRAAGTITAAAFLGKFVGDYPWVHLDIAGPAWFDKDKPYIPKGASGVPVRLLVHFLMKQVEK
ncbi:MAG TPA: leucyl aminopeptidase [Smithellaceae bacterium]|nr:leucyl aminopeptidase [Smithellaceae bacterium]HRS89198.1 leucyl aminopeptidase [Smithellaceae bacterium]HRV26122.1 leucyl aminopeptidase [Smithellaceae bacterium]